MQQSITGSAGCPAAPASGRAARRTATCCIWWPRRRHCCNPHAGDERLALLPMCNVMERVFGLYLALDARVISNYLESPDTVMENLQEVQPTLLGADPQLWQLLYTRATSRRRRRHTFATRPVSLGDRGARWQHACRGVCCAERGAARTWARPVAPRLCRRRAAAAGDCSDGLPRSASTSNKSTARRPRASPWMRAIVP